jgi:hypothetical protein
VILIISTEKKPRLSFTKKIILGYCALICLIGLFSFIIYGLALIPDLNGFIGVWLTWFEIIIGFATASEMNILTTMSTIKARGEPLNEKSIIQQRLRDEQLAFRKPWVVVFILNSLLLILLVLTYL